MRKRIMLTRTAVRAKIVVETCEMTRGWEAPVSRRVIQCEAGTGTKGSIHENRAVLRMGNYIGIPYKYTVHEIR